MHEGRTEEISPTKVVAMMIANRILGKLGNRTSCRRSFVQSDWLEQRSTLLLGCQQQHRCFATSSSLLNPELSKYLEKTAHIEVALHEGIIEALQTVYGSVITIAQLESFGTQGLKALAVSVEQQEMRRGEDVHSTRPSRKVTFAQFDRAFLELDWKKGESLLDLAKRNESLLGESMEGTCGGNMSCSSCHVYLNDATLQHLPLPAPAEQDMLDLAFEPTDKSRLGCQVLLRDNLLQMEEAIIVTLPGGVNNVWK